MNKKTNPHGKEDRFEREPARQFESGLSDLVLIFFFFFSLSSLRTLKSLMNQQLSIDQGQEQSEQGKGRKEDVPLLRRFVSGWLESRNSPIGGSWFRPQLGDDAENESSLEQFQISSYAIIFTQAY